MKTILLFLLLALIACNKNHDAVPNNNVTVKGSVVNEIKTPGSSQEYWKAGIIFNKSIVATGTATITWYFPAGWINGNPSNHYSKTVNFNLTGNANGHYEFTDWKVDYTMKADSVKISAFTLTSGNYFVEINNSLP